MYFKATFDEQFEDLMMYLRGKYPKEIFDFEGIGKQTDMCKFGQKFFTDSEAVSDLSVDANSNVDDLTVVAYENEMPKPYMRLNSLYLIWKYAKKFFDLQTANKIVEMEIIGDIYINDMSNVQKPYCFNFSTYDVMLKGLPFVKKVKSNPPKHLTSFIGQMIHFTSYASNQVMGAVGLADLLVVMSYYVERELNSNIFMSEECFWTNVKQEIQSLIFSCNQPFRGGLQSGFYNVSIYDKYFLEELCQDYVFPDGSSPDINIINKLQDIYIDLMNETLETSAVTFPVTTACFSIDDKNNIKDIEFLNYVARKNQKFAFINIYAGKTSTLSSCCRLRSDKNNEYLGYSNSFGSGGSRIGSFGVVTLNLPRIAVKAKGDIIKFIEYLVELTDISIKINHVKRFIIQKRINVHALPLYDYGFMDIQQQYATTGVNGINEAIEILGGNILQEDGQNLCGSILNIINELNDKADKKYKYAHNLEQTPSENSSIKLAQKDKLLKYQNQYELYSNQFIPLIKNADMLDRIKLQGLFDSKFSGGAICHINCETMIDSSNYIAELIKTSVKMGVVYFALNYNLQQCENSHMSVGKNTICPICAGVITDNFTRVVGFVVNTKNFAPVRREFDYPNRVWYGVS